MQWVYDRQTATEEWMGCTGKEKEEEVGCKYRRVGASGRYSRPVVLEDMPGERVGNLGALLAHVKYPASVLRMPQVGSYAPV